MLKIDHLTSDWLAEVLKGARLDSAQAYHVEHCGDCRRRLATSLLVGRIATSSSEPGPGRHPDSKALARLHAAAFEYEELGSGGLAEYLATLRHLKQCDACFARFFALHQALTPSAQAVQGAVSRFQGGQRARRVGTLLVTRTLEKLRQTFVPSVSLETEQTADDNSLLGALARLRRGDSTPPAFEDRMARAASVLSASAFLDQWLSEDEPDSPVRDHRVARSMGPPGDPARSAKELLESSEERALKLAQLLQHESAEVGRFRKALAASGRLDAKAEALRDLVRDFERLSEVLDAHESTAHALRQAMSALGAELGRIAELEAQQRTRVFTAAPELLSLPDLILELSMTWSGEKGFLAVVARDPVTGEPRLGVELTPQSAGYAPPAASVVTDSSGHARVALNAGTTGLRIATDPSSKPWLVGIEVRDEHPLR